MARLPALPSESIIRGFKGIIDFYLWRGLPCARAWPRYRPARQTDASRAAALLFGAVIKAYILTHSTVLHQLAIEATAIPRSTRDLYVSGVYGNLHEASMGDFLTLLTQCRDFLSALTALLGALDSIDTDELVVNVDESVLPAGASTAANQATAITALQKLDDLQDALQSVALDRFLVRGSDQLFSFKGVMAQHRYAAISGLSGFVDSDPCPAGEIWCVTTSSSTVWNAASTEHLHNLRHDAADFPFARLAGAFPAQQWQHLPCFTWLDPADVIRVYFPGVAADRSCIIALTGYKMTLET